MLLKRRVDNKGNSSKIRGIKQKRGAPKILKDFKAFITRGNVVDLAVGIVIGVAFGAIISSLVKDIIMPPIGLALGNVDFSNLVVVLKQGSPIGPYASLVDAQAAGAITINYGLFVISIINFLIIAIVIFFLIVRPIAKSQARKKATEAATALSTKDCPFCYTAIPIKATRCPSCTSELKVQ